VVSESTRASDNDRNETCQVLDAALEDGQLSAEEHRERVSAATKAATLGQLGTLVSDLQIRGTAARSPALKSPTRRVALAAAAGVVLLAFGATWALMGDNQSGPNKSATSTPKTTSNPSVTISVPAAPITPTPTPQLLNLTGVTGVLAQMRTQFGDTLGYQLNIYQDQALLYRPDTANAHVIVEWTFGNGTWKNMGASAATLPDSGIGDLGKFDVQAVLGVLKTAPQTLQLYDAPQTYLVLESLKDGSLYVSVFVSDATKRSGSIEVGPDGATKHIERPAR
jgi:hypothetical protein